MSELNGTFGEYLKQARLDKGLSIEEITEESKISRDVLIAIEAEDLDKLPDPVFVRGFLKSYAEMVGADASAVVNMYRTKLGDDEPRVVSVAQKAQKAQEEQAGVEIKPAPKSAPGKSGVLLLLLLFAGIVVGSLWLMTSSKKGDDMPPAAVAEQPLAETTAVETTETGQPGNLEKDVPVTAAQTPVEKELQKESAEPVSVKETKETETEPLAASNTVASVESAVDVSESSEISQEAALPRSKYKLNISCTDKTWMKIIVDKGNPREYLLPAGGKLELDAETGYNVLIGNAGGVNLLLNGDRVKVPGKTGQVVTLQLP